MDNKKVEKAKHLLDVFIKKCGKLDAQKAILLVVLVYLYVEVSYNVALVNGSNVVETGRLIASFGAALMVFRIGFNRIGFKTVKDTSFIIVCVMSFIVGGFVYIAEKQIIDAVVDASTGEERHAAMNSLLLSEALHRASVRPAHISADTLDSQEKRNIYAVLNALNTVNNEEEQAYIEGNRKKIVESMLDVTDNVDQLYDSLVSANIRLADAQEKVSQNLYMFVKNMGFYIKKYARLRNDGNFEKAERVKDDYNSFLAKATRRAFGKSIHLPIELFIRKLGSGNYAFEEPILNTVEVNDIAIDYLKKSTAHEVRSRLPENAVGLVDMAKIEKYLTDGFSLEEFRTDMQSSVNSRIIADKISYFSLPKFLEDGQRLEHRGRMAIQELFIPAIALIFSLVFSILNLVGLVGTLSKRAAAGVIAILAIGTFMLNPSDMTGISGLIFGLERVVLIASFPIPLLPL